MSLHPLKPIEKQKMVTVEIPVYKTDVLSEDGKPESRPIDMVSAVINVMHRPVYERNEDGGVKLNATGRASTIAVMRAEQKMIHRILSAVYGAVKETAIWNNEVDKANQSASTAYNSEIERLKKSGASKEEIAKVKMPERKERKEYETIMIEIPQKAAEYLVKRMLESCNDYAVYTPLAICIDEHFSKIGELLEGDGCADQPTVETSYPKADGPQN